MKKPNFRLNHLISVLFMLLLCIFIAKFEGTSGLVKNAIASPLSAPPLGDLIIDEPVAFSPDGNKLAVLDPGGAITLRDVTSGHTLWVHFDRSNDVVSGLVFSPDGKKLASVGKNAVTLWDIASGQERLSIPLTKTNSAIVKPVFSPDSKHFAGVSLQNEILLCNLDVKSSKLIRPSQGVTVDQIIFSPDGKTLVSANNGQKPQIKFWNALTGGGRSTLPVAKVVTDMAFSPNGETLASVGQDGLIKLWNPHSGTIKRILETNGDITKITFSPDSRSLASVSGGIDPKIQLWNPVTGRLIFAHSAEGGAASTNVLFSPDGALLASIGADFRISLLDVLNGELQQMLVGQTDLIAKAAFNSAQPSFAAIGKDGQLIVWDLFTGIELLSYKIPVVLSEAGSSASLLGVSPALVATESLSLAATADLCPCSIWPVTAVPANASAADTAAVELGVKFRSSSAGFITGIRFYKGSGNTGTHVGHLWTSTGTQLASAIFTSESASGWQQVNFPTPVAVTANTVYVASYLAPNGGYSFSGAYFAAQGFDSPPISALQDGVSGGNGVYFYGSAGGFPSNTFNATNYWVDVIFSADVGPDNIAPTIVATTPSNGATGVGVGEGITINFSEALDPATVGTSTIELKNANGILVPTTIAYSAGTNSVTLTPSSLLALSTAYTVSVKGGGTDPRIKDVVGNALLTNFSSTFTTESINPCINPANSIVAENCLAGSPQAEWDITGAGDPSIQGFSTDISVNKGNTVSFKINTPATSYRLDIYRMGYYGGKGARKVATLNLTGPQNQPACLTDSSTGLIDCGNWGVSTTWAVPTTATSGIYFAKAVRTDTGNASHIVFIVRDDNSQSDLLFQTSDTTWQAYNDYGGNSLYTGSPAGRAYKVSYNRPLNTRGNQFSRAGLFGAEYPMVRWLESNGYNISYSTGVDSDRRGAEILEHKTFLSVGHDEYWSASQRINVENARNAGVNLAFFSGNEVFWKTRWEPSIDGSGTSHRTLVTYKETHANAKIDPLPNVWTGTWRDPRFSPPADGGRPENSLTGTLFTVNCCQDAISITVPELYGKLRFWRNTTIAGLLTNGVATLPPGVLGYEWDEALDNTFQPAGLVKLSSTTVNVPSYLLNFGSSYGSGTATHNLTLYRHSSGALVFGAGTIRWPWGLDENHDDDSNFPIASNMPTDLRMQQATTNLLADMGAQPRSLQPGLVAASQSTDTISPTSIITSPITGSNIQNGVPVTITGTAIDTGGGVVANVEVSVDGGASWHPASGRSNWSYSWIFSTPGSVTIKSRAVDDSGNLESLAASVTVNVPTRVCPCTIWPVTATPTNTNSTETAAVELGVKFRSDVAGIVKGIRFYKGAGNTGAHVGKLWSSAGQLLATANFAGETASGWQQVNFSAPVAISANTVYVASYFAPNGGYAFNGGYFATQGVDNAPLHALQTGVSGGNGVFLYGASGGFPTDSFNASNYWVDVVIDTAGTTSDTAQPTTPAGVSATATSTSQISLSWTASTDNVAVTGYQVERCQGAGCTNFLQVGSPATPGFTDSLLSAGTTYLYRVRATDAAGNLSAYSATVSQTTNSTSSDTTSPTAPTGVSATATSTSQISLSWEASTDNMAVTGYQVERCQGVGCTSFIQVGTSVSPGFVNSSLSTGTTYLYRVRATDAADNVSVYSAVVSQTTLTSTTSQTIWAVTTTPATASASDTSAVELGVKFRSDVAGIVKGIRFYKGVGNTGVHVGKLWSSAGQLLATANFAGETASGWQQVNFSAPVAISANTVYVASYFAPNGGYAFNGGYFATQGVDNAPLHALQTGVSGGNGVFLYGASGGFPTDSFNASNYWVDVVIDTAGTTSDTAQPTTPAGVSATATSTSQISLSWTASTDNVAVTGYQVERCQGAGCTNFLQVGSPATPGFTDSLLSAGTTYLYRVRATDAAGNLSGYSNIVTWITQIAPIAVNDTFLYRANVLRTVNLTGSLGLGVLANDLHPGNLPLTAQLVAGSLSGGGALNLLANGSLTYLRSTGSNTVSFRYRAGDGIALSEPTTGATVNMRVDVAPTTVSDNCSYDRSANTVTQPTRCTVTDVRVVRMNVVLNDTDANVTTNTPTDGIGKTVISNTMVVTVVGAGVTVNANAACGQVMLGTGTNATIDNNCDGTLTVTMSAANAANINYSYRVSDDLGAQSAVRPVTLSSVQ